MGRALVNKGGVQKTQTPEGGGRGIVNRTAQPVAIPNTAEVPSRGLVNRSVKRPDTPLAATPEPVWSYAPIMKK